MTPAPTRGARVAVALLFAIVAGSLAFRAQFILHAAGGDHLVLWRGMHTVLQGGDPYARIDPDSFRNLFYPLPAVLMDLPFAWLSPEAAALSFVTVSAAILGYVITAKGFERVPILFSVPFLTAAQYAQSSLFILAVGLLPSFAGLTVIKPNIGLAMFAWRPTWRFAIVAALVLFASLIVQPSWPAHWLPVLRSSPAHHSAIFIGVGFLSLLALARWRRPEARLLVAMATIPHGLYFYDELPIWLVAASLRQSMILSVSSWIGWALLFATNQSPRNQEMEPWVVASLYLPAVVMILMRRNESTEPADATPVTDAAATDVVDFAGG